MRDAYWGIYRGRVEANLDSEHRGRVQVSVPAVFADGKLAWAEPCVPFAGEKVGVFAIPPVGAGAWVQFVGGDPDAPVLAGTFWGSNEAPTQGLPEIAMFAAEGIAITVSSEPGKGGITIEVGSPAVSVPVKVVLGADGIELSTGASSITLDGSTTSLNNGALDVT